jgi:hypothetical protein
MFKPPICFIDKQRLNDLFSDVQGNREEIRLALAEVARRAASTVNGNADTIEEAKQDAIILCMKIAERGPGKGGYDPTRRRAYDYFFSVAKHFICNAANAKRMRTLGDTVTWDENPAELDGYTAGTDARRRSPNNWRHHRINDPEDRLAVAELLNQVETRTRRAPVRRQGDLTLLQLAVVNLRLVREALLGE